MYIGLYIRDVHSFEYDVYVYSSQLLASLFATLLFFFQGVNIIYIIIVL